MARGSAGPKVTAHTPNIGLPGTPGSGLPVVAVVAHQVLQECSEALKPEMDDYNKKELASSSRHALVWWLFRFFENIDWFWPGPSALPLSGRCATLAPFLDGRSGA